MRTVYWKNQGRPGHVYHLARRNWASWPDVDLHDHDQAEFFWVEAGEGVHLVNGVRQPVRSNDVVFLRPSDRHEIKSTSGADFVIVNLAVPPETYARLCAAYRGACPGFWGGSGPVPPVHHLSPEQAHRLAADLDAVAHAPRDSLLCDRLILNLVSDLAGQGSADDFSMCPDWLARGCRELLKPAHFRRGPQALAALCGRSPEHVTRVLRKTTGKTPGDLVAAARRDYAARLLLTTDQTLDAVAEACGFRSLSHFHAFFLKQFGMTPRRYRRQSQHPFPET